MRSGTKSGFDPTHVRVKLLRLFASASYRPPVLPSVAIEVMQLSRKPSVTFDEVVGVLERDPILAAKVLSICQSAMYAPRSPVLSLKQATVRLGLKTLRDLVIEAALHLRVFRVPGYDEPMERLARHSTGVAHLMRSVCARSGIEAEYAFLCGLLHDVGIAACLLALADDPRGGEAVPFDAVAPVLHELHEEASGVLARLWDLPPEIQAVVASHHQLRAGGTPHPVIASLLVAEHVAWEAGLGMTPRGPGESEPGAGRLDANPRARVDEAVAALRIAPPALDGLRAEARDLAASLLPGAPRA